MKVINLFGSSGSGKSTNAAGLAYELKTEGFKVEIITEYAKELCILSSEHLLENQIWVFANQYQKMKYLSEELDFVITDSPLYLGIFYSLKHNFKFSSELNPLIEKVYNSFYNINIFLERHHDWDPYARVQTEEESKEDSEKLKAFLKEESVDYVTFKTGRYLPAILKKYIIDSNLDVAEKLHHKGN